MGQPACVKGTGAYLPLVARQEPKENAGVGQEPRLDKVSKPPPRPGGRGVDILNSVQDPVEDLLLH